jgi:hypothetical protein
MEELFDELLEALKESQKWIAKTAGDHDGDYIGSGAKKTHAKNALLIERINSTRCNDSKIHVGDILSHLPGEAQGTVSEGYYEVSFASPWAVENIGQDVRCVCRHCLKALDCDNCDCQEKTNA